jgi:mRNA interferase RelE/StbE
LSYTLRFTDEALDTLKKMDRSASYPIVAWMKRNLQDCDDPRRTGKALTGEYKGAWRYRVGNYRILALIKDSELVILVIAVGHRHNVYE